MRCHTLEGVRMVVNGGAGFQIVLLPDGFGADPLEEDFRNKQAGRMLADFAVALVVSETLLFIFDVGSGRQLGEGSPLSARQLLHVWSSCFS